MHGFVDLCALAAYGGPPKDRPLTPGLGRATPVHCAAAVDNYSSMRRAWHTRRPWGGRRVRTYVDMMRLSGIVVGMALAALAACGGASAERTLAPGETRPSKSVCISAVGNYEKMERQLTQPPQSSHIKYSSAAGNVEKDRLVTDCMSQLSADEAGCMANASSFTEAQECAPSKTW
jgi:hypothetical protein